MDFYWFWLLPHGKLYEWVRWNAGDFHRMWTDRYYFTTGILSSYFALIVKSCFGLIELFTAFVYGYTWWLNRKKYRACCWCRFYCQSGRNFSWLSPFPKILSIFCSYLQTNGFVSKGRIPVISRRIIRTRPWNIFIANTLWFTSLLEWCHNHYKRII